jgi:hypothetical protein
LFPPVRMAHGGCEAFFGIGALVCCYHCHPTCQKTASLAYLRPETCAAARFKHGMQ